MSIKQRWQQANYINVGTESSPEFELLGRGFITLDETPAAQIDEKRYINDRGTSRSITSYSTQFPFTCDYVIGEENVTAIEWIASIAEQHKVGSDAETEYVIVELTKPATGETTYEARKYRIAIEVANFTSENGVVGLDGNLNAAGDPIFGTFNTSTKTFTEAVA